MKEYEDCFINANNCQTLLCEFNRNDKCFSGKSYVNW